MTSEVPGLAEAFQRPAVNVGVDLRLTDGETLSTTVSLPDAVGMLALKVLVRTVRTEDRDVEDLWRCLEIAAAGGTSPAPSIRASRSVSCALRYGASSAPAAQHSLT